MVPRFRAIFLVLCFPFHRITAENVVTKEILMPMLSSTMTEGTVGTWMKNIGEFVKVGDAVLTVESDKAEMDVEAFEEGYLAQILVQSGSTAKVGEPLALLVSSADQVDKVSSLRSPAPSPPRPPDSLSLPSPASPSTQSVVDVQKHVPHIDSSFVPSSVDADIKDHLPPGYSSASIADELFTSVQNDPQLREKIQKLRQSPKGEEILSTMRHRAMLRAPSPSLQAKPKFYIAEQARDILDAEGNTQWVRTPGAQVTSPSALVLAQQNKLSSSDVARITPTGPFSRVTREDVERHLKSVGVTPSDGVRNRPIEVPQLNKVDLAMTSSLLSNISSGQVPRIVPLTAMQKAIAKNMEKTMNVPVFRVTRQIGVDRLYSVYAVAKKEGVTWSVVLAKAVATALSKDASLAVINAAFDPTNQTIRYPADVNVAVAVSTEEGGLTTPVLRQVDRRDIFDLSNEWTSLVSRARARQLKSEDITGGTIFISNLGHLGVDQFDAILPPNAGTILAVGGIKEHPVADGNIPAKITIRREMSITLTCDHRHINGVDAANFLAALATLMEEEPMQGIFGGRLS